MTRKLPKYALHKRSGHARVRINGKDYYLGEYDSPESHEEYDRLIAKYVLKKLDPVRDSVSIARLAVMYVEYAKAYYANKDGKPTSEVSIIQLGLKPLVRLFGREKANAFGPRKLKMVREDMISRKLARTTINKAIQRVNRMLRWATENEYIDGAVFTACRAISGLRRGRSEARETTSVRPVPPGDIDAIELFVSRPVWSMIQLQLCTGMRPGEVCMMRACDIHLQRVVGDIALPPRFGIISCRAVDRSTSW